MLVSGDSRRWTPERARERLSSERTEIENETRFLKPLKRNGIFVNAVDLKRTESVSFRFFLDGFGSKLIEHD